MKWEILKGSDKDFEGAPEWARFRTYLDNRYEYFVERHEPSARVMRISDGDISEIDGDAAAAIQFDGIEIIAERRPITEPVWDGEGLPPVGVRCEFIRAIHWYVVEILYISGYHVVVKGEDGAEQCYQTSACQFRPISLPEDVAKDEATKAMNEVWREHAGKEHNGKLFSIYEIIYEGIAAGKIPGVKLE